MFYSQSVVFDHVEIISDEIVDHVTKIKMAVMLRIRERETKQQSMMELHAMGRMVEDVAVFSNVISVNAQANREIMAMVLTEELEAAAAMTTVNQKIMRIPILRMGHDVAEIHVFAQETDRTRTR